VVDLIRYLPDYYEYVREMNELMGAQNPEIDALWEVLAAVKRAQFIMDADEARIRRWEKVLRIQPDRAAQSLDYRKAVVILRLSTRAPLTFRWLNDKVVSIVGAGNFVISLYHDLYFLQIRLTNDLLGLTGELRSYLRQVIPANLGLSVEELYSTWGDVYAKRQFWGHWDEGGGVVSDRNWGDKLSTTWGEAALITWGEFFHYNTWGDIRKYDWGDNV